MKIAVAKDLNPRRLDIIVGSASNVPFDAGAYIFRVPRRSISFTLSTPVR
jgi:hypothetical protein